MESGSPGIGEPLQMVPDGGIGPAPLAYSREYHRAAILAEGNCDNYQTEGALLSNTRPASIPIPCDDAGGTALREKRTRPFTI